MSLVASSSAGDSKETAVVKTEEGGDDVKSSWPLRPGLHTYHNGRHKGKQNREVEQIPKSRSQFGSKAAIRLLKPESLVIADQLRRGEYVPESCTHRPSSHESGGCPKPLTQPEREGSAKGKPRDWD